MCTVADPRLAVGRGFRLKEDANFRRRYVSKNLYVETKELGPFGGGTRLVRPPMDPPMVQQRYSTPMSIYRKLQFIVSNLFHLLN